MKMEVKIPRTGGMQNYFNVCSQSTNFTERRDVLTDGVDKPFKFEETQKAFRKFREFITNPEHEISICSICWFEAIITAALDSFLCNFPKDTCDSSGLRIDTTDTVSDKENHECPIASPNDHHPSSSGIHPQESFTLLKAFLPVSAVKLHNFVVFKNGRCTCSSSLITKLSF